MPKFVEGFADRMVVPAGERDMQVFANELAGFGITSSPVLAKAWLGTDVVNGDQSGR